MRHRTRFCNGRTAVVRWMTVDGDFYLPFPRTSATAFTATSAGHGSDKRMVWSKISLTNAVAVLIALLLSPATTGEAGSGSSRRCARCQQTCPCDQLVECTIMVPTTVVVTRMESHVVHTTEEREETYTVFVRTPVERTYSRKYWYLDDEIETQEITRTQCQVVMNPVVREYNVQVPAQELRTFTVPSSDCAQSDKPGGEKTCEREVTVLRDEPRACTDQQAQLVFQTNTSWIDYCKKVPKSYEVECGKETVYELQPKTETRKVVVFVPKIEKRPVHVEVCKMLPQTILCCTACAKTGGHLKDR